MANIGFVNSRLIIETGFRTGFVNSRIVTENASDAGNLAVVEDDDTLAADGFVSIVGDLAITEEDDQLLATGEVGVGAVGFGSPEFIYLSDATAKYHFKRIK